MKSETMTDNPVINQLCVCGGRGLLGAFAGDPTPVVCDNILPVNMPINKPSKENYDAFNVT